MPSCFLCNKFFATVNFLTSHFNIQHDIKNITEYICKENECFRSFSSLNSFKKHLKQHNIYNNVAPIVSVDHVPNMSSSTIENNEPYSTGNESSTFINETPNINNIDRNLSETTLNDVKETVEAYALSLSCKWYGQLGIPRNKVQDILDDVQFFMQSCLSILKLNIDKNVCVTNDNDKKYICSLFRALSDPFVKIKTEHLRLKMLDDIGVLVRPVKNIIGYKMDDKLYHGRVAMVPKEVQTYSIPLRIILKKIFEHSNFFHVSVSNLKNLLVSTNNSMISNFVQSKIWKAKILKNPNKLLFPLFLYYDDFEVNDPLGSHAGSQKLGAVYVSIPCLPSELMSSLENIFLALLFKTDDKKSFGNFETFKNLIAELNFLETDGITVNIKNTEHQVFFSLGLILGDNLGMHSILGFSESFMAKFPCRFCKLSKEICKQHTTQLDSSLRNKINYADDLNINNVSLTGIKELCVFNQITSFHVTENLSVDIMHDMLEGVCKTELANLLYVMINQFKYFDLETLNNRIECFNYTSIDIRNRPPLLSMDSLKNSTLKMSASETLCFTRYLGVIIGDKVPTNSEFWSIYILIRKILDLVMSRCIEYEDSLLLQSLIDEHHELYLRLFKTHLRPKHHHMTHYPHILRNSGPLVSLWSMRFEAKHKEFKDIAHSISSRKNIPYTLSLKSQLKLANTLLKKELSICKEIEFGKCIILTTELKLQYTPLTFYKSTYYHNNLNLDSVSFISWVNYKGTVYNTNNMVVVIDICEDDLFPRFGIIKSIFIDGSKTFFVCCLIETINFDNHFQAYHVNIKGNLNVLCISIEDIVNVSPTFYCTLANGDYMIPFRN